MDEEKQGGETKAVETDDKKPADGEAIKEVATGEAEAENKMDEEKIEEPSVHILKNPSRVLRYQRKHIEFLENNRYKPILPVIIFGNF